MDNRALFINGVYESVLEEIRAVQEHLPEQVLFLQPYSGMRIAELRRVRPTVDDPMRLYISTTADLPIVAYTAEIVGWDDKELLPQAKRELVSRIQEALQPGEQYEGTAEVNLIHVRRMSRLESPFSVSKLIKISNGKPLSTNRSRSGGWSVVRLL